MVNGKILVNLLFIFIVVDNNLGTLALIHKYNSLTDSAFPAVVSLVDTTSQDFQASINDEQKSDTFLNNVTHHANTIPSANISPPLTILNDTVEQDEYVVKAEPKTILSNAESEETAPTVPQSKDDQGHGENGDNLVPTDINVPILDVDSDKNKETMPVFSEWAQKQLEEAEKNKEQVINISAQNLAGKNKTVKSVNLKHHTSKNYASPDCNAKIIAANPESSSMSSVLSPLRDEYALNTCTSKIWFVVELCESIQAKRIDLANFELFSSSPKDFSVSVSARFPTRDWSNVGQFTARDERTIQSFDLHPHLFGKYIKVEVLSHYGKEHFCPISLFRVYGTSEFEAFETENPTHPVHADIDEDTDLEEAVNPDERNQTELNLFGSARDAVMSIMKKAAEVLTKTVDSNKNITINDTIVSTKSNICRTPSHIIVCDNCSDLLYSELYEILSCRNEQLDKLIKNNLIKKLIHNTNVCLKYGLDFSDNAMVTMHNDTILFFESAFEPKYVVALCNAFAIMEKKVVLNTSFEEILPDKSRLTVDSSDNNTPIVLEPETLLPPTKYLHETETAQPEETYLTEAQDIKLPEHVIQPEILNSTDNGIVTTPDFATEIDNNTEYPTEIVKNEKNIELIKNEEPPVQKNIYNIPEEVVVDPNINAVEEQVVVVAEEPSKSNGQEQIVENYENMFIDLESNDTLSSLRDPATTNTGSANLNTQNVPKESILIRLSNRLKALERNMSLSGQYLEELSKRYRNKVEELHSAFDAIKTTILEESKNRISQDQKKSEEIMQLQQQVLFLTNEIRILTEEKNSIQSKIWWIIQFVLIVIVIAYIVMELFYKGNKQIEEKKVKKKRNTIRRRKSVEGVSGHISPVSKKRRPSTEALNISGTYKDLLKQEGKENVDENNVTVRDFNDGSWIIAKVDKKKKRKRPQKSLTNIMSTLPNSKAIVSTINGSSSTIDAIKPVVGNGTAMFLETGAAKGKVNNLNNEISVSKSSVNNFSVPQGNGAVERRSIRVPSGFLRSTLYRSKTSRSSDKSLQQKAHNWDWYRRKKNDPDNSTSHRSSPISDFENMCENLANNDIVSDTNSVNSSLNSSVNSNNFLEKKDKNKAYFKKIFKRVF
ncbi:SUN domain-containing ossification factor isoform X3 [Ctenocephalides felis]|uniref:SUN domain-containing ossification factor isoform X3 n=1 Tax=Ctenocephalides felis TaxID=7515 RepID=UPI000E6E1223|nr:SUN domain-containing ossification factor isoform X3 [Ctenocephalides felis]